MNVLELVRDKVKVKEALKENPDGSVACLKNLKVYIPKRFEQRGYAELSDTIVSYAVVGIVVDDKFYSPITSLFSYRFCPSSYKNVILTVPGLNTIDTVKEEYIEMEFEKGDVLIESLASVQVPEICYYYFMEFIWLSKIPWYIDRTEVGRIMDLAYYQGAREIGVKPQCVRLLNSYIYRDHFDLRIPYRYSKGFNEGLTPLITGCNNRSLLVEGTLFKLMSGELNKNIVSSMLDQDTRVTELERIVKGNPDDSD